MKLQVTVSAIILSAALTLHGIEAYGTMLAVRYSGNRTSSDIILVDEINHTVNVLASSGTIWMNSLARDSRGWFWTAAPSTDPSSPISDDYLIRINPFTGQTTVGPKLKPTANSATDFRALAFSPDGSLYGMAINDKLVRINMSTGDTTYIGRVGVSGHPIGVQGMAFTPDGTLYGYGVDYYGGFIRIAPADASWQYLSTVRQDVQALTSSASGVLYGARDSLYQVNKSTGSLSTVMTGLGDVRGIGFVIPLTVPEPTALQLCCAAAIPCLSFSRWRRRKGAENRRHSGFLRA